MTTNIKNTALIITAAGSSTRMGGGIKKEYMKLGNGTVLSTAARAFLSASDFSIIIITIPQNGLEQAQKAIECDSELQNLLSQTKTQIVYVQGADTRQASIMQALNKLAEYNNISHVLIHDGARPFVSAEIVKSVMEGTINYGACIPCIPAVDTLKEIDSEGTIKTHLLRKNIRGVQTPQGFDFNAIFDCHKRASNDGKEYTDDSEIWDAYPDCTDCRKVHTVPGDIENIKITYPKDLKKENKTMTRIGFGTDFHRLEAGRKFYLGGIEIPSEKGEVAHSDGDVLLHAITDALLGAAGLGDIGTYFPPEEPEWKDADSAILLKTCWNDVKAKGWTLGNMDCVLEFEQPKFLPWRQQVIDSIASILEVESSRVFVKAKTNEKMDSVGQGLAIKAYCSCLLESK